MKKIILIIFSILFFSSFKSAELISINSNEAPKEIYGNPAYPIKIRMSNGGAGATGIFRVLSEDYILLNSDKKFTIA